MPQPQTDMRPLPRGRLRSRSSGMRRRTITALAAVVAVAAGTAFLVLQDAGRVLQTQPSPRDDPAGPRSDNASSADETIAEAPGPVGPTPAQPREMATIVFEPPFEIIDGRTFASGGERVEIFGIDTPDADDVCLNDAGTLWACGLRARATLSNLTRNVVLGCVGTHLPETGVFSASCKSGDRDLALALIDAGFALPQERPPEALRARAMLAAEKAKRGLWDGEWTIRSRR